MKYWFASTLMGLLVVTACEKDGTDKATPPSPSADADLIDARAAADAGALSAPDAAPAAAQAETKPALQLPLTVVPPALDEVIATLRDAQPVGRISGEVYDGSELVGIVRAECGEGAIVQPLFRRAGEVYVSTPIRLPLFGLATTAAMRHQESVFEIESHFVSDTDERLAGTLKIAYDDGTRRGTFIDLEVDARPMPALLPPRLEGKAKLPSYTRCTPSGYVTIEAGGETFHGLVHTDNVAGRGAPSVWLPLRPEDVLHMLVIPPRPELEIASIDAPFELLAAREKAHKPVVVLAKMVHTERIVPDADATSANVGRPEEASILDGKVTELSLEKVDRKKTWRLRMTLEGIIIPETLDGELAGRRLDTVRIDTMLAEEGALEPMMPAETPSWWQGADDD